MPRFPTPPTRTVPQIDTYHGVDVRDPYRWLEDMESPEVQSWIDEQNAATQSWLEEMPERARLRARLTELWSFERRLAPIYRGGRFYQLRNSGLLDQDQLFVSDALDTPGRLLLDPNHLAADGPVALTGWSPSPDGRYLGYAVSGSGSDWQTIRVREVESGRDLPECIEWCKFTGVTWLPDSSGFLYCRYPKPAEDRVFQALSEAQQLCVHRLGTPVAEDRVVFERPDEPQWGFDPRATEDGRWIILHIWKGSEQRNRIFYAEAASAHAAHLEFEPLIGDFDARWGYVGNTADRFYLTSDLDAPRGRLMAFDRAHGRLETVLPENEDILEEVELVDGRLVAAYLHQAYHRLRLFTEDGSPAGEIPLPEIGSVLQSREHNQGLNPGRHELFFAVHSFLRPTTLFRFDLETSQLETLFAPTLAFDAGAYETRQLFATSRDGTRVPMFVVQRRDRWGDDERRRQGPAPLLLSGYGGFNLAQRPSFAVSRLAWLELGGAWVMANLRGGGEFGESWHQAGMLDRKQNVFDDFIACAEMLIDDGYTSRSQLAISGGSNGGLLVGACLAQRPDLFAAALPAVGVMDMLRYHRFTIGWAWASEYGSSDDPAQFRTLLTYSPLHNLEPGKSYPATMILTSARDDRVVPLHSFKFAAALQAAQGGDAPILLRVQRKAGHGLGKPTTILIDELVDTYAFLLQRMSRSDGVVQDSAHI